CWRKEQGNQWILGCSTETPIPHELISGLCESGGIERRRASRTNVSVDAELQAEESSEKLPIEILDFSDTGVRLAAPTIDGEVASKGDRVALVLQDTEGKAIEVQAQVRWTAEKDGQTLLGAEVQASSLASFQAVMARQIANIRNAPQKPFFWGAVAAAIVYGILGSF
ncbi:MAG: PilZ domain-containing protein, partial [Planctomycetota bacterium]